VADEIQPGAVGAENTVAARGEATLIADDFGPEHSKRGAVSGCKHYRVECSFGPIGEAHAAGGELRDAAGQLDLSGFDRIGKVKTDQRDGGTRGVLWKRERRRSANRLGDRSDDRRQAEEHGTR